MKKFLTVFISALLLVSLAAGGAFAAEKTIHGRGTLTAAGVGTAKVAGRGKVSVKGRGVLVVTLSSHDAVAEVHGYGRKRVVSPHTTIYYGFHGRAKISGSRVKVRITGRSALRARGQGWALLKGRGRYHIGRHHGHWHGRGLVIDFKS